jgi:5-methylcytosine-specific restriction protein A
VTAEFPPTVLSVVHARSDWWCEMCGRARAVEHHHRRPRGMGSTNQPDTTTASACLHVCRPCHRLAETERNLAMTCGWLVSQYDTPTDVPVVYRGEPVRLDDLGNLQPVQETL